MRCTHHIRARIRNIAAVHRPAGTHPWRVVQSIGKPGQRVQVGGPLGALQICQPGPWPPLPARRVHQAQMAARRRSGRVSAPPATFDPVAGRARASKLRIESLLGPWLNFTGLVLRCASTCMESLFRPWLVFTGRIVSPLLLMTRWSSLNHEQIRSRKCYE